MKHDLFISYSRVDSAFVLRLVGDLKQRGIETWLDQLDIPPGVNWDNEIEKALDQAKIVVVVLSAVSAKSENLKNEIGAALERSKQIVPIVLAKGAVPLLINRLQREDFTGDYEDALDKLVHRLSGGSRSASLRAISPEEVARTVSAAAARLAVDASPAPAGSEKAKIKAMLSQQLEKLDKNGDGVISQDELQALHTESIPDSLAPATRERREPGARKNTRTILAAAGGVLALAAGLTFALTGKQAPPPAPQPTPVKPVEPVEPVVPPVVPAENEAVKPIEKVDPAPHDPVQPEPGKKQILRPIGLTPPRPNPSILAAAAPIRHDHMPTGSNEVASPPPVATAMPTAEVPTAPVTTAPAPTAPATAGTRPMARLCRGAGFTGMCRRATTVLDLRNVAIGNDVITSVGLGTCSAVKVCTDIHLGGTCEIFTADQPDLAQTSVGAMSASSIECFPPPATMADYPSPTMEHAPPTHAEQSAP